MASLALAASIMFLVVLIIGPASYIISSFINLPKWIIYILAIINILIGLWWLLLPLPVIRYIGLVDIYIGWRLCDKGEKKK
jgi:cytochrome c biogenesis protein CcdA